MTDQSNAALPAHVEEEDRQHSSRLSSRTPHRMKVGVFMALLFTVLVFDLMRLDGEATGTLAAPYSLLPRSARFSEGLAW